MKGFTKKDLVDWYKEFSRLPIYEVRCNLDSILKDLYHDKTKRLRDEVVHGLTFDDLLFSLIMAKGFLERNLKKELDFLLAEILDPPAR